MPESRAAAFERVFRAEHASILAFCFRRVDDLELARDLTAEAFRIAWSRWEEPRRSDRAWLFGVARNLIGNEYSRRATRPHVPLYDEEARLFDTRTDAGFTAVDVHLALGGLPPTHREVLRMTYWDGLSAAECGELLGISTAAVWVRLSRARRAFSAAWSEHPSSLTDVPTETAP